MKIRKIAIAAAALAVIGFTSACVPESGERGIILIPSEG